MNEGQANAFVVGHPIGHSRSPLIHNHWLKRYGLSGHYEALDVDEAGFPDFLSSFHDQGFVGGNVTLPHKVSAYELVDQLEGDAQAIGAVNTVWRDGDQLVGSNTDALGFARNLDALCSGWRDGECALVLGAGGAAKAVVFALIKAGYKKICMVNRTLARAEQIAEQLEGNIEVFGWGSANELALNADMVVNTTSLGISNGDGAMLDFSRCQRTTRVTDIVYTPLQTPFLRAAEGFGLKTADGLGMLLHQAAPGFARWFGVEPDVDAELRALVTADLESQA